MIKTSLDDNRNPSFPISIRKISKKPYKIGSCDTLHIELLTYGSLCICFGDDEIQIENSHLCIVRPGEQIILRCSEDSELYEIAVGRKYYNEMQTILNGDGMDPLMGGSPDPENAKYPILIRLDAMAAQEIESLVMMMIRERAAANTGYTTMIRMKICELLILIKRLLPHREIQYVRSDNGHDTSRVWTINDVIYYIQKNYTEHFTLNTMAARCALNSSYFSRSFREEAGMPLFEFINTIRIRKACHLLKRSDMSILEIAYAVGYNNISFFNRYFKKLIKTSPRDYRKYAKGI